MHRFLVISAIVSFVGCSSNPGAISGEVGNPAFNSDKGKPTLSQSIEDRYRAQQEILARQKAEDERQNREIEELRLQHYQNQQFKQNFQ